MLLNLIYFLCFVVSGTAMIRSGLALFPCVLLGAGVWIGSFLVFVLLAALFLWICCAAVDYDRPQTGDSAFYRKLAGVYIEALIQLFRVRIDTTGLEKLPKEGRFLLVCNHQSEADPGVLLHYFKNSQLAFISKQENRDLPFVGKIMHKILCQLIDRDNDRQALRGILNCINIIKEDKASIAVFPEGGIKIYGKLSPFRPGVFKIATKTNVPIVVCTLLGTQDVLPNIPKLRPTQVQLHLVDVISPQTYAGMKTTELSEMVHDMMLRDLGPDYIPDFE